MNYSSKERVSFDRLCEIISYDIERLLLALDITTKRSIRSYSGHCLVHGGDNNHALSIYERDGIYRWSCKTRSCHKYFTNSMIGLTQGVLSHLNEGWESEKDMKYPFGKAVQYLKSLYGLTDGDLIVTEESIEKKNSFN